MQKLKDTFAGFWKYRYLLQNLISRDFKLKYRRSVLGVAWSVLNPLLTDRKSTRLNSSHPTTSRMPSSA